MICSSACNWYGFSREDSAAAMHCLAYSLGAISVGIETLGRISYFSRCLPTFEAFLVVSLELGSKSVGEVALLDIEERAEEASSISVIIEDAMESRALSGLRRRLPSDVNVEMRSVLK